MDRRALPVDAMAPRCFDAVRDLALRLASDEVEDFDRFLAAIAGVRFVPATRASARRRRSRPLVAEELYEVRIAERREVPTRPHNLHDLLNALCWAAFPAGKWALTERLAEAQRARLGAGCWKLPGSRSRLHDRLALIDEGGVLIAGDVTGGAERALAAGRARALVFGHGLLEHAVTGRFDVSGAALAFPVDPAGSIVELRRRLDRALAALLARGGDRLAEAELPRVPLTALEQGEG
jgi:hypothetical protein